MLDIKSENEAENTMQDNILPSKLSRGLLCDATYQTPRLEVSMTCGFRQEDFFMFSLNKPM